MEVVGMLQTQLMALDPGRQELRIVAVAVAAVLEHLITYLGATAVTAVQVLSSSAT
jgi:hypothetical protein